MDRLIITVGGFPPNLRHHKVIHSKLQRQGSHIFLFFIDGFTERESCIFLKIYKPVSTILYTANSQHTNSAFGEEWQETKDYLTLSRFFIQNKTVEK